MSLRDDLTRRATCTRTSRRDSMGWLRLLVVLLATLSLTACEAIGDIFQAGMAVGVIMVVVVIGVIGFVIAKIRS